jgi:hypothetical protein
MDIVRVLRAFWEHTMNKTTRLFLDTNNADRPFAPPPPRSMSFFVLLVVTCASQSDFKAALGELAGEDNQFFAYQDYVYDG